MGRESKPFLTHPSTAQGHNSVGQHIISRHIRTRMIFILSLHRAFWYSHSSFTNRCTFIKTL